MQTKTDCNIVRSIAYIKRCLDTALITYHTIVKQTIITSSRNGINPLIIGGQCPQVIIKQNPIMQVTTR